MTAHLATTRQIIDTFEWFHHVRLLLMPNDSATDEASSTTLMMTMMPQLAKELPAVVEQLAYYGESMGAASAKLNACESNAFKRLEWARTATPLLTETSKTFEQLRKKRNDHATVEHASFFSRFARSFNSFD